MARTLRAAGCVYAEDEADMLLGAAHNAAELKRMVGERVAGLPIEHIVGWAEFMGLRIAVGAGVFVPRRRSEFLAAQAIALVFLGAVVADIACGSGALGAAVSASRDGIELYASDIDPSAVTYARRNLAGTGAHVYRGDLCDPLPASLRGHIDVLIANVPYVPTATIEVLPTEARLHEPRVSLDGGADGLDIARRVAAAAADWLAPGGHLLIETGADQAREAKAVFMRNGLTTRRVSSKKLDATVIIGTKPIKR